MSFRASYLRFSLATGLALLAGLSLSAQNLIQVAAQVPDSVPAYAPRKIITEPVKILGTDSFEDTASEWNQSFRSFHPESSLAYTSTLSSDAIKGLVEGQFPVVLSSRDLNQDELAAFQKRFGYVPVRIPICIDAIIVFVNRNNPVNEISVSQLDAVYSSTRLSGTKLLGETWGELGAKDEWKKRPITPYLREEGTAIRGWLQTNLLRKGGKYKDTIQSRTDAMSLAEAVVTDPSGIACYSMQSWFSSVKVLRIVPQDGMKPEPPTQEAIYAGRYPLVRSLFMFVNQAPGQAIPAPCEEFARFLLSREGQTAIASTGFIPGQPDFLMTGLKRMN
jgi:phosphate transport system substrate-binding protein